MIRSIATLVLGLGLSVSAAQAQTINPLNFPAPEEPGEVFALIEIPAGSFTKYETDADTGLILVDRFQSMPVVYPANYASITSTLGADGDPLDGLVFSREPIVPGALIKVRPIGVLHMVDGGQDDDKIIAVPVSDVDPTYDGIVTIDDLPEIERQRIEAFFRVYKQLPEGRKVVELNGFTGVEEALTLVNDALAAHAAQ
ncbi:MAG: inorganic diphosphatase [Devosia sp.]